MENTFPIYRKNHNLSLVRGGDSFVVVSLYGRIKILKCMPSVLQEVLDLVDGQRSTVEITKELSRKYPLEDINNFLLTLIKTEIIIDKLGEYSESDQKVFSIVEELESTRPVVLIGRGEIAEAIQKKLNEKVIISNYHHINSGALCSGIDSDVKREEPSADVFQQILKECEQCVVIACPDMCTFGWLIALNDACLSLNIPFILCYYNGKNILLGPMAIPGKPPCYGCLLEHRRRFIEEKSEVELTYKQLLALVESWPIQKNQFDEAIILWVANYVVTEAKKIAQKCLPTTLVKTQIIVPPLITHKFQEVSFELTTSCPSCSGMNEKNLFPKCSLQAYPLAKPNNRIIIPDQPVVYESGGRRSTIASKAMKMIEQALFSSGLKVKFEKQSKGSLDNVLFRYVATIENKDNSCLPLLDPDFQGRGKGITEEQAYLSAAFEMFERISSNYFGQEEIVRVSYGDAEAMTIDLQACIGKTFHEGVMDSFKKDTPIDWIWGYSLIHHCPKLVPASMVFLGRGKFMGHFFDTASGGLAAGATIEDAILQGLLELIEQDAWMIWQTNAITVPKIQLNTIKTPRLVRILANVHSRGLRVIVRNYITEFSIPVFRTWMVSDYDDYSHYATNGFGANLDPDVALERSISEAWLATEMDREEELLIYRGPYARDLAFSHSSLYSLYHFNQLEIINDGQSLKYDQFENKATSSVAGDIQKIISCLQSSIPDVDVVVVDLTKEAFNIPVVRVIVSGGLQRSGEPNLSMSHRVFELPKMLGYRQNILTYKELYNGVYPH